MVNLHKPWLNIPAGLAYRLTHPYLRIYGALHSPHIAEWNPFEWRGLKFSNRLGISGGMDKNAEYIRAWWAYGSGFIEVGTVTPEPQNANPGTILRRDILSQALWNKMGFPNKGVQFLKDKLLRIPKPYATPVFVNIGKNRITNNEQAVRDYLYCIRELKSVASLFVVNVSSPNTAGLRELLKPQNLTNLLKPLVEECGGNTPLLLKLSPDMTDADFIYVLKQSLALGVDGWILTNSTLARSNSSIFPNEGGVSGQPLASRSKELLKIAVEHLGPEDRKEKLLVSSGGILSAEDVQERLRLGAQLVQVYSALVFEGAGFFRRVSNQVKI